MVILLTVPHLGLRSGIRNKITFTITVEEQLLTLDRLTYYHAVSSQTDDTPLLTASLKTIDTVKVKSGEIRWLAVSQKIIKEKLLAYGDTVKLVTGDSLVDGNWIVNDCMNKRWDNHGTGYCADLLTDPGNKRLKGLWKNVQIIKYKKLIINILD